MADCQVPTVLRRQASNSEQQESLRPSSTAVIKTRLERRCVGASGSDASRATSKSRVGSQKQRRCGADQRTCARLLPTPPINKQILLVTGSPRSGTTWVGQVLASAPRTAYLLEPFNVSRSECYFELPISRWYERLDVASDGLIERRFAELFAGRRVASGAPIAAASLRTPIATLRQMALIARDRASARFSSRMVMKDPIALLSADWLARPLWCATNHHNSPSQPRSCRAGV